MSYKKRIPTLRTRMVWLVAACLAPAFLMAAALLYFHYEREQSKLVSGSAAAVRALSLAVDGELAAVETALVALAGSPALRQRDLAAFDLQARELVQHQRIANVVLTDLNGQQLLNTRLPAGAPLPLFGEMELVQSVIATKKAATSKLFSGLVLQQLQVSVGVPVMDKDKDKLFYVLAASIVPARFAEILALHQLPDDRGVMVLDRAGKVVAQNGPQPIGPGQKAPGLLLDALRKSSPGQLTTAADEANKALLVFSRSAVSGWAVAMTVPRGSLKSDALETLRWLMAGMALLLLATLGLAWAMGGQIARAIHALGAPAQALGQGRAISVPVLPIREVEELRQDIAKGSEMLSRSEARMRGILESAMDAIITIDENQRIVLYNGAAERIFGWPIQQVLGERLEKLMPERFRAGHAGSIRRFSAMGTTSRRMGDGTVLYGRRANGEEFPMEAAISQLDAAEGRLFTVILRDVTTRVRAHEALERSNLDLQQFAFVASHDLKTPLRSIGGFVQILERNYADKLDEKALALIRRTRDAVDRLEHLTEDLLSYARVNSDVRPFALVNGRDVADEVIHLLDAVIRDIGAVVTVGELPSIFGDRSQLVQLLLNLVGNAIKYCRDRAPVVHVSAQKNGLEWVFSVTDNGIGVDPKHHDKIFEVFKRLHSQKEYAGTGIGLAVCRRVVERHGGRIWIKSTPGEGSQLSFTIPDTPAESSYP